MPLKLIKNNFHPVSKFIFLSKVITRVVTSQYVEYLVANGFSVWGIFNLCRQLHSTETALVQVQNDLIHAKDRQEVSILMMGVKKRVDSLHFLMQCPLIEMLCKYVCKMKSLS